MLELSSVQSIAVQRTVGSEHPWLVFRCVDPDPVHVYVDLPGPDIDRESGRR